MKIRPTFQLIFLIFVTLAVYYPALTADICSVDDAKMIVRLENQSVFDFLGLFRPGSTFYYRPLTLLSFYSDKFLWDFTPSFMHLENMVLHAANAVMTYFIACRVFANNTFKSRAMPLICALLFALHPINTESVNWISGRTDLLATFFVLLSCRILIWMVEVQRPFLGLVSAVFFFAGIMSKEVSLFFLPAGCFLAWRWPFDTNAGNRAVRYKGLIYFTGPFVLSAAVYVMTRFSRFGLSDAGVTSVLDGYRYDTFNTLRVVCKGLGFYVKKLFMPIPLNFAITSVSDSYVWIGLLLIVILLFLISLKSQIADFFVISVFLISPAIIIALTGAAWTPLAERYLYLPAVFWSVSIVGFYNHVTQQTSKYFAPWILLFVVLVGAGWITFDRNLIWQSNLTLFTDTVRKNPDYPPLRNELASALLRSGRVAEAEEQLMIARRLDPEQTAPHVHLSQIQLLVNKEHLDEAKTLLHDLLKTQKRQNLSFLRQVARIKEAMSGLSRNEAERRESFEGLLDLYQKIMKKSKDPFIRYRAGQISLFLDRNDLAIRYFSEAYQSAPESAYYRQAARTLVEKLMKDEDTSLH